ncbi:MAG: hypothetical protein IIB41_00675 [Candidatus Marinimicrobia bacterium]|nr:hypothetical protein [Candidatus Neomarinimicrobiota bacterium]
MNKLTKLTILFFIVLLPFTLLLSQDGKYRSPKSFGSEAEYIEYRMSSINDVSILTFSNEIIAGKILTMTDTSIAICKIESCYDWRKQPVLSFDYSEVNKLVVMKKGQGLKGAGIGFLIGAATGAFFGYLSNEGCTGFCVVDPGAAAVVFGILVGIPGAIIGGITGSNQDEHYQIIGSANAFWNLHKKIGNEAIFSELPKNILIQD